jgi:hypothetical protein
MRRSLLWMRKAASAEQLLLTAMSLILCRLLDALADVLRRIAKIGEYSLPRAAIGGIRLDQSPVRVTFAVLLDDYRSNEHTPIVTEKNEKTRGQVFTTWAFSTPGSTPQPMSKDLRCFQLQVVTRNSLQDG